MPDFEAGVKRTEKVRLQEDVGTQAFEVRGGGEGRLKRAEKAFIYIYIYLISSAVITPQIHHYNAIYG